MLFQISEYSDCKPGMDTPINPDSLLVATSSLAHLGNFDVSALIRLANNLKKESQDISCEVKNSLPQC